ncbi:MAG: hypothetical protein QNJ44_16395 [Rhodobacter sp.]|nr:hypothetical protein [Rhodobacter sp.]
MQQIGNPSHVDRGRIVVPAALLSGIGAGYLADALIPRLAFFGAFSLAALTTIGVAWHLGHWLARRQTARESAALERRRAAQIAETEAALRARAGQGE